ncbi:hypothetical protein [Saccharothrix sp.]|uniref:hypothetical protein n=1 Tax=Saccharothrix sp. TaxID=1873460 RepID=UPI0028114BD0|nr:hypothetical protein [Saccharothrix sp.]
MALHALTHPIATTEQRTALTALMAPPETAVSDAPLHEPQAAGGLLLGLLISPPTPKEPKDR